MASAGFAPCLLACMVRLSRTIHVFLEIVGATAIVAVIGWFGIRAITRDFVDKNCHDTQQRISASPDGSHTIKSVHTVCGNGDNSDSIFLS